MLPVFEPFAVLVAVQVMRDIRLRVIPGNRHIAGAEHFAQFIADQVHNSLEVHFSRQPLLDAVDHSQFRVALLGLFKQALGFTEQPRVLQRERQAGGERHQQVDIRRRKSILAVQVLQAHHPARLAADDHRHAQPGFGHLGAGDDLHTGCLNPPDDLIGIDHQRPAGFNDLAPRYVHRHPFGQVQVHVLFDRVMVEHAFAHRVILRDHHHLRVEGIAQLVAHQVIQVGHLDARGKPLLHAVDQIQLGLALLRAGGIQPQRGLQVTAAGGQLRLRKGIFCGGFGRGI